MEITELEPKVIWRYFYEITQIPRSSKKEGRINEYLHRFAEENGLRHTNDEAGNTVIYAPASEGMEQSPTVILQSHVDMVCEKNSDVKFDFDHDPIEAYVEEGWVKARGTTLGADCGIGMAVAMAILTSKNIAHPAIEALFTVDEETGMTGARRLGKNILSGKYLINLDSEDEGEVFIGCAGGIDTTASFKIKEEETPAGMTMMRLDVKGLQGGHSGDDINKGYANANRLLARFFFENRKNLPFKISRIEGGNLRNAIPREAYALFGVPKIYRKKVARTFEQYAAIAKAEYATTEPDMTIELQEVSLVPKKVFEDSFARDLIAAIVVVPNGVTAMSQDIKDFVETSTNLASIKRSGNSLRVITSQRSSVESKKAELAAVMNELFTRYGAHVTHSDDYPGWTPIADSPLLELFKKAYKKLFGREIAVKAVHAGLECGLILEKYPNLEMVSVGPTLRRVHSPDEKLEIATVGMFWDLMKEILRNI